MLNLPQPAMIAEAEWNLLQVPRGLSVVRHLNWATGEDIAATYLASIGYGIRSRNIRLGKDEIDILAHDPVDDVLVFAAPVV